MCKDKKYKGTSGAIDQFVVSDDLNFTIRYFRTFEAYTWHPFYRGEDYGEIGSGLIHGDRYDVIPMLNGWVYIFKKTDSSVQLYATYQVQNGSYQIDTPKGSKESKKEVKAATTWMTIKNYFKDQPSRDGKEFYVVVSKIKLSTKRLTDDPNNALIKDPTRRGVSLNVYPNDLDKEKQECRTGPQIYLEWQKVEKKGINIHTYNLFADDIGGVKGLHLLVPDVEAEAARRNDRFRKRNKEYGEWLCAEETTYEKFILQAVKSIIRQQSNRGKYIKKESLELFETKQINLYKKKFFPVYYAINNLVEWLENDLFIETLRDYSFGDDNDQASGNTLYNRTIKDIAKTEIGAKYLGTQYDDKKSFINQITQSLLLKEQYDTSSGLTNGFAVLRKWDNVIYGILEELLPVIAARTDLTTLLKIVANIIKEKTGIIIETVKVKPVSWLSKEIEAVDIEKFLGKASKLTNTPTGKGIVSLIEGLNVVLGVVGVCYSTNKEEFYKNFLSLIGSAIDFSTNCWLIKDALERKIGQTGVAKLQMVSGVIDCFYGLWMAKDELGSGDNDAAFGWSIFAIGGAIMAVGAFMRYSGGRAILVSGGTAIKPGAAWIAAGCIVEGIGLAVAVLCDNNEVEDWLTQSLVGTKPKGKSLKDQVQGLNDILCKFEVGAKFEDVADKFSGRTYVTLEITPRIISENSRVIFSGMKAIAKARLLEFLNPFSNDHDITSGMAGSENPVLDMAKPNNCVVYREKGRITKITTTLSYGMDIDEVSGKAKLELNNGTLQGYTTSFKVEA